MSIMLKGHELFKFEEITKKVDRVKAQLDEVNSNISSYENKIAVLDTEIQELFAMMVMEDNIAEAQKSIADRKARKNNYEEQLKIQYGLKSQLETVLKEKLPELLQRAEAEMKEDIQVFHNVIERKIFEQLAELRYQQEELLFLLNTARLEASKGADKIVEYRVLNGGNWTDSVGVGTHNNPQMKPFNDIPSPFFNIYSLKNVKEAIQRNYVDTQLYGSRKRLENLGSLEDLQKYINENCK